MGNSIWEKGGGEDDGMSKNSMPCQSACVTSGQCANVVGWFEVSIVMSKPLKWLILVWCEKLGHYLWFVEKIENMWSMAMYDFNRNNLILFSLLFLYVKDSYLFLVILMFCEITLSRTYPHHF